MIVNDIYTNLCKYIYSDAFKLVNHGLEKIVQNYSFYLIQSTEEFAQEKRDKIANNIKNSKLMIIYQNECLNDELNERYLLLGIEKTLIVLEQSAISFLIDILNANPDLPVCFISNNESLVDKTIKLNLFHEIKNREIEPHEKFVDEITSFDNQLKISPNNKGISVSNFWNKIKSCISCCLIKKSYLKMAKSRIRQFIDDIENSWAPITIKESEYIELRMIGAGSSFSCYLIYYITRGELCVIKKPNEKDPEWVKLFEREKSNYMKIRHPFIPKYFGDVEGKNFIVIEFIGGQTLDNIDKMHFTEKEKIIITFQLIYLIKYLHEKKLIYRDLKANNVIINKKKGLVLIDFDRLIPYVDSESNDFVHTLESSKHFAAPEVILSGLFSYKSDIYSLGKMISYIFNKTISDTYSQIKEIIESCMNEYPKKRPSIFDIFDKFNSMYQSQIKLGVLFHKFERILMHIECILRVSPKDGLIKNDPEIQLCLGIIYNEGKCVKHDIGKAIHYLSLAANQNNISAQFILGFIYYAEEYVKRDINKAIHYFSLAADQNDPGAQFTLGVIYHEGEYVRRDINKAIHYFSLAADQNDPASQSRLGLIYYAEEYVKRDINKAIHYFLLAADQNDPDAQFSLGSIYHEGIYVRRNINKAIHYFSLAAGQNHPFAQLSLGEIYYEGEGCRQDINKAIHYFSLAANQNVSEAQYNLGVIYQEGKYVRRNINKAIHYFSLAADQNHSFAQLNLGIIYCQGKLVSQDIKKAIHYYYLAAEQNCPFAQYNLGCIYSDGKYVPQDMSKAIHYFQLASNQNLTRAHITLGYMCLEGKYVKRDISKGIHYFLLAANQNDPEAQFQLGLIYHIGDYDIRDINKAIHYYSLAANQNDPKAQFQLGLIYHMGDYDIRDINKAIHYYSLAANQNDPEAQFQLGLIYHKGDYDIRDINKAIHYYSLAANQNDPEAQFNLGEIYLISQYFPHDINKAIQYLTLAANQNHQNAQFILGFIYHTNQYVTRDIYKAIHYLTLSADQNLVLAQLFLGIIYGNDKNGTLDINKAIHYYSSAANQNDSTAQFNLGVIYYEGKYVTANISKAIHYFTLAANQNDRVAQYKLGFIYFEGVYVTHDINKAIHYFSLAANQNDIISQLMLGFIFFGGKYVHRDIKKGIHYIELASKNGDKLANFMHGFLLHEGKYVKRDIQKAIYYYKEASSFNIMHAKNNLGIINKYGYEGKEGSAGYAIEYFNEAIDRQKDCLSMYNLAHIYIYDETIKHDIDKSIDLLINSYDKFLHSQILLCLVLVKNSGFNLETIKSTIKERTNESDNLSIQVVEMINYLNLFDKSIWEIMYEDYRNMDFVYNIHFQPILFSDLMKKKYVGIPPKYPNAKDINTLFYEGFGSI